MVAAFAKKNSTPEEKKVQALMKAVLLSDYLVMFIDGVNVACSSEDV